MMKKQVMKKLKPQTLDLGSLETDGSFCCPSCGALISPDDESEETYTIVDTKVVGDELTELVISCMNCGSVTRVVGFQQILKA